MILNKFERGNPMIPENELELTSEPTTITEKHKFVVGDREEPLDVLHYLIKKNEINIYDIVSQKQCSCSTSLTQLT